MGRLLPALALSALACSPPAFAEPADPPWDPGLLHAPHRRDGRFFNPWAPFERRFWGALRWYLSRNPYDKSSAPQLRVVPNDGSGFATVERSASVTWVGHATVLINFYGTTILTDPMLAERLAPPHLCKGVNLGIRRISELPLKFKERT